MHARTHIYIPMPSNRGIREGEKRPAVVGRKRSGGADKFASMNWTVEYVKMKGACGREQLSVRLGGRGAKANNLRQEKNGCAVLTV